jgi:HK97 family phage portal protein
MSFWDAIENLFRGPSSHGDGLPFSDLRRSSALTPRDTYANVADTLPRFELGKARWPDFDVARYDSDAYRKIALIFRCLSLISHAAGTAKVRVYDEANDDEEIADHPMRRLIRQPNPRMGEARFWGTVALRAGVAGFCVVEKERDGFGDVIALKPLKSSWLKAVPRGGDRYDWEYRIPGVSPVPRLRAEDVIAFTWADTSDGSPYGLPPLATAVRDVAILDKLTQFVGNLLDSGGVPMWMLPLKAMPGAKLADEEIKRLEDRWTRRRGGVERRGMPWITDNFDVPHKLSLDPDEIAMGAIRDLSDLAICQAFGVPPRKAGIRIGLEHTTQNATAQVEDAEFYRDTIVPLWSRLDDALTTGLLTDFEPDPESGISLEFDDSDVQALQEDRNAKATWVVPGFTGGAISHHGLHRELGLPLPETPDFYVRGLSVEAIPADDPLQLTTTTTTTTAPPQRPQTTPPPQLAAVRIVQLGSGPAERLAKRKAIGAANKRLIANVAEAREPSIRRFLKEQASRIAETAAAPLGVALARSNGHAPHRYAVADVDWDAEAEQLEKVLRLLYQLAASTAFDAASDHIGTSIAFDLANPRVQDVIDRLALRVVDITQQTRDLIADVVTKGEQAGKSITEIADDIRASTGFSEARANVIARTESMVSFGHASTLAYRESGVVDRIQCWDNGTHTDDYGAEDGLSCAARDGLIDTLDSAELHLRSEHPNGSLALSPVLIGED